MFSLILPAVLAALGSPRPAPAWAAPVGVVPPRGVHGFSGGPVADGRLDGGPSGETLSLIDAAVRDYLRGHPAEPLRDAPLKYQFFPLAGTLNEDVFPGGYVDLDPAPNSLLDFHCMGFVPYDDHTGTDCVVRSFSEVVIGMPVFAPLDGTVAFAVDGNPDMNTDGGQDDGNYVIIDHGGGRFGWYFHLKRNSVAESVGQHVVAGQQIGLAASSGHSFGPHLHFQTMDQGDTVLFEPWAGACRPGESGFVVQPPVNDATFLIDGGTTWQDLFNATPYPFAPPLSGQIALDDPYITVWTLVSTLPPSSNFREKILRPDNSVAIDGGPYDLGNPSWYRVSSYFFYWYTPAIPGWDADHLGTWHYVIEYNGHQVVSAPFELRAARTPEFNRPPQPFTTTLDTPPPAPLPPRASSVLFCRVHTDPVVDDLDYDVLSFQYVWTVNGQTVRTVTSAAHCDAIPRGTAHGGDVVRCVVTASDGRATTGPVSRSVLVVNDCPADWDGNGHAEPADIAAFVNAWFGALQGGTIAGDFDGNGVVEPADVAAFVSGWFAALTGGC